MRQLRAAGKSLREIGEELGVSHETVRRVTASVTRSRDSRPVRLHPDPHRAAGTVIAARGQRAHLVDVTAGPVAAGWRWPGGGGQAFSVAPTLHQISQHTRTRTTMRLAAPSVTVRPAVGFSGRAGRGSL
jgi:hypothetical protein